MPPTRKIAGFLVRVVLIYGVLIAPWPGLRQTYAAVFRTGAETLYRPVLGARLSVAPRAASDSKDTLVSLQDSSNPGNWYRVPCDSRLTAYLAFAETAALILATPMIWPARIRSLIWGVLLIHGFVALRMGATLCYMASMQPAGRFRSAAATAYELLAVAPTPTFLVPAVLWAALMARARPWATWSEEGRAVVPARRSDAANGGAGSGGTLRGPSGS